MTGTNYAGLTIQNTSIFYGYGYKISNWTVESAAQNTSFFGEVYSGVLDSLVFKNCSITTTNSGCSILTSGAYASEVINNIVFDNN